MLLRSLCLLFVLSACTTDDSSEPSVIDVDAMEKHCISTVIHNETKLEWDETDQNNLNVAKDRCKSLYKNSPCLKSFNKHGDGRQYYAICGAAL